MKDSLASAGVATVLLASLLCSSACSPPEVKQELNFDEILSRTSSFQRQIVQDNEVSKDEYEQSILAWRSCVIDAGAEAGEIVTVDQIGFGFDVSMNAATQEQGQKVSAEAGLCSDEYNSDIAIVWFHQNLLTESQRDRLRPEVIRCLIDTGVEVSDSATTEEINSIVQADLKGRRNKSNACIERYPQFFAISDDAARSLR